MDKRFELGRNQIRILSIALFLQVVGFAGNSSVAAEMSDKQGNITEFQRAIRNGDCDAARKWAIDTGRDHPTLQSLPNMYFQVIECDRGDWRDLGISIIDFYTRQIDTLVRQGRCSDAEEAWRRIEPRFRTIHAGSGDALWLFRVAVCYEPVNVSKSAELFESLIKLHPDHDKAGESRLKINWLKGDRTWAFRDLNQLSCRFGALFK
jgi:hypothetical protein